MPQFHQRVCRACGCTDDHACPGGCSWVLLDVDTPSGICSVCADELGWSQVVLAQAMVDEASSAIFLLMQAQAPLRDIRMGFDG